MNAFLPEMLHRCAAKGQSERAVGSTHHVLFYDNLIYRKSMQPNVRELEGRDFPRLKELDDEVIQPLIIAGIVAAGRPPGSFEDMCSASMREHLLFGLERQKGEKLAGYVAATLVDDWAYVEEVAVELRFRRQGLGKALMMRVIEQSRQLRLIGCSLTTDGYLLQNGEFFHSVGFRTCALPDQPPHLRQRFAVEKGIFAHPQLRVAMVLRNEG